MPADATTLACVLFEKTQDESHLGQLTPWALQDRLIAYSEENARPGEDPTDALARLTRDDAVAKAIARAAYAAEQRLQRALSSGQQVAGLRKHVGSDAGGSSKPREGSRDHLADLMEAIAKRERRDDETFYDAYARLLDSDEVFKRAYAAYEAAER